MTSMIHSRAFNPVLYQKIRVTTDLYGVQCRVYTPVSIPSGFMNYSDIEYSPSTFLNEKLLVPKAVVFRHNNPFTGMGFSEEEQAIWSTKKIPKYSKIVVVEVSELLSFIVSEVQTTEDTRTILNTATPTASPPGNSVNQMYFKYTLVPSSSVTAGEANDIAALTSEENTQSADPAFHSSINDMNRMPQSTPNPLIKVGKL
ncbi:hypothetical protein [Ralstonia phage RP13]|nr:hypothetical protein [Ralstonia phage RP13]